MKLEENIFNIFKFYEYYLLFFLLLRRNIIISNDVKRIITNYHNLSILNANSR